jgi:hemoglobin-like flavoprotein
MALDIQMLRDSFEMVVARQPALVARFYDILFERYPQSRALFGRNSRPNQEKMLTGALVAVMDHLDDAPWFSSTLAALGAKHRDYGVTEVMYEWVGECLLATLAEVAGPDWTPALAAQWTEAYTTIAANMIAGARRAAA